MGILCLGKVFLFFCSKKGVDAKEILKVIGNYSKALDILDDYAHRTLTKIKGSSSNEKITYDNCIQLINKLRFNEESYLFTLERNNCLKSIINNIYQTYGGEEVYPSIEEKAANFIYMIVKIMSLSTEINV